jgi:hypothetical protein
MDYREPRGAFLSLLYSCQEVKWSSSQGVFGCVR